jgi:beta-glucosidase
MLMSDGTPSAINAAATFNRTLMRRRATEMGAEFRGKGINVALAPAMYVADVCTQWDKH